MTKEPFILLPYVTSISHLLLLFEKDVLHSLKQIVYGYSLYYINLQINKQEQV